MVLLRFIGASTPAEHREGAKAFLWLGMILPLALGIPLAAVIHEAMHRPFAVLLPDARRRFLRSHAMAIGCGAAVCATLAYLADRTLAIVPLFGIALALMTMPLPFEPGWRFAGSRLLAAITSAATAGTLMFAATVKDLAVNSPLFTSAVGLGIAALNFGVAFSAFRLRARANVPHTTHFSAALTPQYSERIKREALLRKAISSIRWQPSANPQAIRSWVRRALYERFGHESGGWSGMMMGIGLGIVAVGVVLALKDAAQLPRPHTPDTSYLLLILLWAQRGVGLRAAALYPLSRTRRARATFAASAWQLAISFAIVLTATGLSALISAHWSGRELQWSHFGASAAALSLALIFAPLVQWAHLHAEVNREPKVPSLCFLLGLTGALAWSQLAREWPSLLLSPVAIALAVLLVGLSQFGYYTALMRFYRRGDLLQRTPQEAKFGLI